MACVVCQHCHGRVIKGDGIAVREGYSYHKKCDKCYVCSETNLHNAEVFKGVIFCSGCSQRIFQGCSTARKSKNGNRAKTAPKSRAKSERSERNRHQHRRAESARHRQVDGVLELTRLAASSESDSSNAKTKKLSSSLSLTAKPTLEVTTFYANVSKDFKKKSIEIGMTTEVTQELLRQLNCPVIESKKYESKPPSPAWSPPKEKGDSRYNKKAVCSDLRIAELGASTEIAHMALRKKSEQPVIIKSENGVKRNNSSSLSGLNQDSDVSGDSNEEWLESGFSLKRTKDKWLDITLGSILKMPYKYFKKNVLDRSSLINVLASSEHSSRMFMKRLRLLFHEEITEHRHRGVKRLYSTINKRRTPYRMGWLNLVTKVSAIMNTNNQIQQQIQKPKRCKHFKQSHSYRCMRHHVMSKAGPTKSELAVVRGKVKNVLTPPAFFMNYFGYSKRIAVVTSQACGSDALHHLTTQIRSNCGKN